MQIDPFDILSGKVVQNERGTFWFKEAGCNVDVDGFPITENLHRENDLPAMEWKSGSKSWWLNGTKHRENGPAFTTTYGYKEWYYENKLHRLDGPAVETGNCNDKWFINDVHYTEDEFSKKIKCMKK